MLFAGKINYRKQLVRPKLPKNSRFQFNILAWSYECLLTHFVHCVGNYIRYLWFENAKVRNSTMKGQNENEILRATKKRQDLSNNPNIILILTSSFSSFNEISWLKKKFNAWIPISLTLFLPGGGVNDHAEKVLLITQRIFFETAWNFLTFNNIL